MAVTYGYFNSVNGDRKYNADQMSEYFEGIINEGVCQHIGGGLAVTAGTGMAVSVASGKAFIGQKWIVNDSALTLSITAAADQARIDAVVLRRNNTTRSCEIVVKNGTPSASPSAPSMTRTDSTYEMALAYVNVAAGATSVTVTDKRADTTVCGWATVAQSTSGEVDQMLNDMKTGFDGVTYPSPAAMVQGEDAKINDALSQITGNPIYYYEKGCRYSYSSIDTKESSDTYDALVVPCQEGDIFNVRGYSTNTYRLWVFWHYDGSNNVVIDKYAAGSLRSSDWIQIEAPENATYLTVNTQPAQIDSKYLIKNVMIKNDISTKKIHIQYVSGSGDGNSTERLSVYVPTIKGYIRYDYGHSVKANIACDCWRMLNAYLTNEKFTERYALTYSGEWECALLLDGRWNFSGGVSHGNEIKISDPVFFVNGKEVTISTYTSVTPVDSVSVISMSYLYDPGTSEDQTYGETEVAYHGSEHIWTEKGLKINQTIRWLVNDTFKRGYLAMHLPNKTRTNAWYNDYNYEKNVVGSSHYNVESPKVTHYCVFNTTNATKTDVSIEKYPSGLVGGDKGKIEDHDGDNYNKVYFYVGDGLNPVENGTEWKSTSVYSFESGV